MAGEPHEAYDRAVARLAVGYALRAVHRAAEGTQGDVLDGVIRVAIADANVHHLSDDPILARTYSELYRPVPDDLRRPVSVNSVAASLNLPFETTRRRVAGLIERGFCRQGPNGVWVTAAIAGAPLEVRIIQENFEDLRWLHQELSAKAAGLRLEPQGEARRLVEPGDAFTPYRASIRASMSFMLRFIAPVSALTGDLLNGLILLTIGQANSRHVAESLELSHRYGSAETPIPEAELTPVSVQVLARTLDLSFETARRRVRALEEKGFCARRSGGVYMVPAFGLSLGMRQVMTTTCGDLQRMYSSLWRLGVRFD